MIWWLTLCYWVDLVKLKLGCVNLNFVFHFSPLALTPSTNIVVLDDSDFPCDAHLTPLNLKMNRVHSDDVVTLAVSSTSQDMTIKLHK
jgi:hypothetical protein